jgi:hypothetical protein
MYLHLLGESIFLETTKSMESSPSLRTVLPALENLLCQHFTKVTYVGARFHDELVQRFYETCALRITNATTTRCDHILHESDPFGSAMMFSTRLRNVTFFVESSEDWGVSKSHVSDGLGALIKSRARGCKVTIEVKQEANLALFRVIRFIGSKLWLLEDVGYKVGVMRGERVIQWKAIILGDRDGITLSDRGGL